MPAPLHVVGAAIVLDDRCLAARRGPAMERAGKWEFPGGKVEAGEDPRSALVREIGEELGVEIEVGPRLGRGRGGGGPRRVVLDVYLARLVRGRVRLGEHSEWGWFGAAELSRLDWAEADLEPLRALLERLGPHHDRA